MKLPMKYVYLGITIGAAVMGVHALDNVLQLFAGADPWTAAQPEKADGTGETADAESSQEAAEGKAVKKEREGSGKEEKN